MVQTVGRNVSDCSALRAAVRSWMRPRNTLQNFAFLVLPLVVARCRGRYAQPPMIKSEFGCCVTRKSVLVAAFEIVGRNTKPQGHDASALRGGIR